MKIKPISRYLTTSGTWRYPDTQQVERAKARRKRIKPLTLADWGPCPGQLTLFNVPQS